jgi:Fe2+ or Zn2+ uptake regulation protein
MGFTVMNSIPANITTTTSFAVTCSSVKTLDVPGFADGLERTVRQMGYTNVTHTLEIFGTCTECQARAVSRKD